MPIEFLTIEDDHPSSGATEHMVTMRDGVRLATDVYLPDRWTTGPVILVRLPYDKSSRYVFFDRIAPLLNQHGYAVVVQDVRGKFRSEGETRPFVNETHDGYDTLDWIASQGWSDGRIGMFGDSYYGFTQWAALASEHPALRAIVPRVTGSSLGASAPTAASADGRSTRLKTMWQPLYLSQVWVDNNSYDYIPDLSLRPISDIFEDIFTSLGKRSVYLEHATSDSEVKVYPGAHPFDTRPLPVLHLVGWFDNIKEPSMADYLALADRPDWAPLQYLWVDSIDHESYRLTQVPIQEADDHAVNEAALQRMLGDYLGPAIEFFDVYVAETRDAATLPKVRWHLGHGTDEMNTTDQWPPPGTTNVELYLADAARATSSADGGSLVSDPTAASSTVSWVHNPEDLVPSTILNTFAILYEYPDETGVCERPDVLTFTAPPQETVLDLAGPVTLTLDVTSTAPSTDTIVKLLDVRPDGRSDLVAWGDGQVVSNTGVNVFTIDLGHVGYRVRAGHRLRVQIASSSYPWFQPNPGVDQPAWSATETAQSEQTLTCSSESRLSLSVLSD